MIVKKKKAVKKKNKSLSVAEKVEKSQEGELPSKRIRDTETQQLVWFLVVIGVLFLVFFGTYYGVQSRRHFTFEGAEWFVEGEKEGWGDLILYHARYPVVYRGVINTTMNLWFYNDPRENDILSEVNFSEEGIGNDVIVTFTPDLMECGERSILIPQIAQAFGTGLPWTTVTGAVANLETSKMLNLTYADCGTAKQDQTVILVREKSEPKVFSEDGCYIVQYSDCEDALMVAEKLILELIRQLNG